MNKKEALKKINIKEILDQMHDGLSICDAKGELLYVSDSYEDNFNASAEELIGKSVCENGIVKHAISDLVIDQKTKIISRQENRYGKEFFVTGVPVFNEKKEVEYVVAYNSWEINNEEEFLANYNMLKKNNARMLNEINVLNKTDDESFEHMIEKSERMKTIIHLLQNQADRETPIFISGEKGCGKKYLARYVHSLGNRSKQIMMFWEPDKVTGISYQEDLFGTREQAGIFEICDQGILAIENVEKINFRLQNELAYYIKNHIYRNMYGEEKRADIRLIFTSVYSASYLKEKGMISADLYYAIGLISIDIPPIRQRIEDLRECVFYFLRLYNQKYNKEVRLSEKAESMLLSYDWPNNVKEIKFTLERIVLMNDSKIISAYDLPNDITEYFYGKAEETCDLKTLMEFYESQIIMRAYKRCKTSVAVAKELNISQASASRKLHKYIPDYKDIQK